MPEKRSLLLIDRSQELTSITRKILERGGYSVLCANSLTEARDLLIDNKPDAIVMEIELPDGNGLDYCRELREITNIPILSMSNHAHDEMPALSAGATGFIKKPHDINVMKARLDVLIYANKIHANA